MVIPLSFRSILSSLSTRMHTRRHHDIPYKGVIKSNLRLLFYTCHLAIYLTTAGCKNIHNAMHLFLPIADHLLSITHTSAHMIVA